MILRCFASFQHFVLQFSTPLPRDHKLIMLSTSAPQRIPFAMFFEDQIIPFQDDETY